MVDARTPLDDLIERLEATETPLTEEAEEDLQLTEEDLQQIRDLDLTSCDFCGGGCCDPDCYRCYSPLRPENLRTLAQNIATAAMLCRAHQLLDEDPAWRPGCNIEAADVP